MATIRNDRDLLLQNSAIRILSSGIDISASNTSFSTLDGVTSPATITLTLLFPSPRPSASKVWSYALTSAPNTWTNVGNGDSITITREAFIAAIGTGSYIEYKCSVTEPLYTDSFATYKVNYSSAGADGKGYTLSILGGVRTITYDKDGLSPAPSQTAFSASFYENSTLVTPTSYAWSGTGVLSGTSTATTFTPSVPANYATVSSTISLTVIYTGGVTVTQTVPISITKAGLPATSLELTNEAHVIATDNAGNGGNYTGATTTATVYRGGIDDSANWTFLATKSNAICSEATSSTTQTVTNLTADTGYVEISASRGGYATLTSRFSLTKAKGGIAYQIVPSVNAIAKSNAGVYSPTTINFSTLARMNTGTSSSYSGRYKVYTSINGTAYTLAYTSAADEVSYTYTVPANITHIKGEVYLAGNTTELLDIETIPILTDGAPGVPGTSGTKSITISAFKWSNAGVGTYAQAFTYTWSTGGVSVYPTGWTAAAPSSPATGYTLYQINLVITDTAIAASTASNWSSAVSNTIGYRQDGSIGNTGASARIAYQVTTSASPPGAPSGSGYGDSAPAGWSFTATSTLSEGYYMYQTDGLYNAQSNVITWNAPYLSNLKVGSLSAISANLGTVQLGATGSLYSTGKSYGAGTGVFLGYSGGPYKFDIGSTTSYLRWDGSALDIRGNITGASTLDITGKAIFSGVTEGFTYATTLAVYVANGFPGVGITLHSNIAGNPAIVGLYGIFATSQPIVYAINTGTGTGVGGFSQSIDGIGVQAANSAGGRGLFVSNGIAEFNWQIKSNVATGNAPFVVSSSTLVANLRSQYCNVADYSNNSGGATTALKVYNDTAQGAALTIPGNTYAVVQGDKNFVYYLNGGAVWTYSGGFTSDKRLKNSVDKEVRALPIINALNLVSYTWKTSSPMYSKLGNTIQYGLYAQDVQTILPDLVEEVSGSLLVNKIDLIPYLIKAVQELSTEINNLKQELKNVKL